MVSRSRDTSSLVTKRSALSARQEPPSVATPPTGALLLFSRFLRWRDGPAARLYVRRPSSAEYASMSSFPFLPFPVCYPQIFSMFRYAKGHQSKKNWSITGLKHWWQRLDRKTLIKNLILLGLAGGLFCALILLAMFAWYSRDLPDPNELINRQIAQSTKIYDHTDTHLLYEIAPDKKRTLVTIDQIPANVINATITAEDRKFYKHFGIDPVGILRALLYNVMHLDATGQGASTITQQFVKKAMLTDVQDYSRKIREIMISLALEQRFNKEEILQMYLNEIPYGGTNYGIEAAAQEYFGKSVKDVTLAEAATLAALPNRPTRLMNDPELLKSRRDWILQSMADLGYVTQDEANAALAQDTPITIEANDITAPHFVMWVKSLLEETYGTQAVETGGLHVITTLDYDKQQIAEEAIDNGVATYGSTYGFTNAGLLAMNPKTGEILAMVGSPDFSNDDIDGQVNVTLQPLQPGSSIKPIVYAAAFEKGYTPNTVLWDVETTFSTETGPYNPHNYDSGEHGMVTMRKALQGSLNIPAVKTLYLVGIDNAVAFAQRLGYSTLTDRSSIGLSMVLGGAEVKMIDHVGAYAALANNGMHHNPLAILKVTTSDGTVLEERNAEENTGTSVLDSNIAATITNVMSDNAARAYVFGASNYLTFGDRAVAAKTGTTNNYKDAWTVGYTPSLVAGVWVGNASGTLMTRGADGSKIAAPVWNEFMKRSLQGTAVESFPAPSIPTTGKAVLDGQMAVTTVTLDRASGKLATDRTPESFKETKTCGEFHTILQYVDKNNPIGPVPENPEKDPYYTSWEGAVQSYIARHNAALKEGEAPLETCTVPTEEDDLHVRKNEPSINIKSPDNNDTVDQIFTVELSSGVKRTFNRVDYAIDGTFIMTSDNMDEATLTLPSWVSAGSHTLSATIYDDIDNNATDSITIDVREGSTTSSNIRITNPFTGQIIDKPVDTSTTYTVAVEIPDAVNLVSLELSAHNLWDGSEYIITSVVSPSAITSIPWTISTDGQYILTAVGMTRTGESREAMPVTILVKNQSVTALPISL